MRQTLSNVSLTEQTNPPEERQSVAYPSTSKTEAGITRNSNVSIPLQQSRDKPSIYRKLFESPFYVQNKQLMPEIKVLNPGYLHTTNMNVPRNLPYGGNQSSDMVEQDYQTKLTTNMHMPELDGFSRLPIDGPLCSLQTGNGYTTESHRIPLGKSVRFSPSVTGRDPEGNLVQERCMRSASKIGVLNIGVGKEMSTHSTLQGLETSTNGNTWVAEPAIKENDSGEYMDAGVVKRLFTRSIHQGFESATGNDTWAAEPAFMKKSSAGYPYSGVSKGISTRTTINGLENSTSGSLSIAEPTITRKEGAKYTSLVAAASASLNSKLRRKAFETKSAFKRTLPVSIDTIKTASPMNLCTPTNERKILVPTPLKPVVARNDFLSHEMASGGFISRHRQTMRDALVKSRDHAKEVLLDAEVSLYARNIEYLRKYDDYPRLVNPLAKRFNEGDERVSGVIKHAMYS